MAPGYSIEPLVQKYARSNAEKEAAGFGASVLGWSLFSWTETWVTADRGGDDPAARTAVAAIRANARHEQSLGIFPDRVVETRDLMSAHYRRGSQQRELINRLAETLAPVVPQPDPNFST